jgi:hypothetical protein
VQRQASWKRCSYVALTLLPQHYYGHDERRRSETQTRSPSFVERQAWKRSEGSERALFLEASAPGPFEVAVPVVVSQCPHNSNKQWAGYLQAIRTPKNTSDERHL